MRIELEVDGSRVVVFEEVFGREAEMLIGPVYQQEVDGVQSEDFVTGPLARALEQVKRIATLREERTKP